MVRENDKGMPAFAMWIQCVIVVVILALVSFGGKDAQSFYNVLTLMVNVSMTIPYLFLTGAFPAFKQKTDIDHSINIFKTKTQYMVSTIVVMSVIGFANIFTIIEPLFRKDGPVWGDTLWQIAGPVLFSLIALLLFNRYERRKKD